MKKLLLFIYLLLWLPVLAQKNGQALVDSLVQQLPSINNDTLKARTYNRIFNELINLNANEALQYARIGLQHAQKMKWPKGIAVFQNNLGRVYSERGNYDSTLYFYTAALQTHNQNKDQYNVAVTYNNLGAAAQNIKGDFANAASYYFKALQIAEALHDSTILALSLNNIAHIYMLQSDYKKALDYHKKTLAITQQTGNLEQTAAALKSIGKTYYSMQDADKAKEYFNKALSMYEEAGDIAGLAETWSALSLVYGNDYNSVVAARIKAQKLWNEVNPMHIDAITNTGNLGVIYLDIVRYDTSHRVHYNEWLPNNQQQLLQLATTNLQAAIEAAKQTGDIATQSYFTGVLAEAQALKNDYKNAYYNYRWYSEMQDSIYSQENKNKIAAAESEQAMELKNNELQLKQLALSNQQKTLWGLAIGLLLLSVIGALLYRQNIARQKTNKQLALLNQQLDNANQTKTKLFGILSHDLRSPIARLVNFLHLQKEAPDLLTPEQITIHQEKITHAADALLVNMESLLLWSKSQMEQFSPSKTRTSVAAIFEELQTSFIHQPIPVSINTPDGLQLYTDKDFLYTILTNLISNAIKALQQKESAQIWLRAEQKDNVIVLSVSDNGGGFPADFLHNWQSENLSLGSKHGLGMYIVKDLAKAIDCRVNLYNNEDGAITELQF